MNSNVKVCLSPMTEMFGDISSRSCREDAKSNSVKTAVLGDEIIKTYFGRGYSNKEILEALHLRHQYRLSNRQLNRILSKNHLCRHGGLQRIGVDSIRTAIQVELNGSGRCLGYRSMTTRLRTVHDITVQRSCVRELLGEMDPNGVVLRTTGRLSSCQYKNKSPNYLIHIDGYDKIKRWGFAIHGAICGFSRRVLWLRAATSNNNPRIVASYFVGYISDIKGVPRCIRMDDGTENGQIANIQRAFRSIHSDDMAGDKSVLFGSSHSNQRIERWWRTGREQGAQFWIDFFKDLKDSGIMLSTPLHKECLQFCFMELIQSDLDKIRIDWNQHRVRASKMSECPPGKPDVLFELPELYGLVQKRMGCTISNAIVIEPDKELKDYLTEKDIHLVRESWQMLAEDMSASGMVIFRKLLNSDKSVRFLFKRMFVSLSEGEGDDRLDENRLEEHALIVMQGLGAAVESLEDSVYLTNVLITMGKRHRNYDVQPYMFQFLWLAIEHGLHEVLRNELDDETHKAWKKVFDYLASKMAEGLMTSSESGQKR